MPSRLFALKLAIAFFQCFFFTAFSSDVVANEDHKSIQTAIMANILAEDLNSGKVSNEIRQTLLMSASLGDQQNIKSLLARWKKSPEFRYDAQFDQLVIFRKGAERNQEEVFRIFPKPSSSGSYFINGREWAIPKDGNTFKSLSQFFRASDHQAANSIFELIQVAISRAHALSDHLQTKSQAAAFFYILGREPLSNVSWEAAQTRISRNNPSEHLLRARGNFFEKTFKAIAGHPKDVQCTPTGAKGRVLVDKEPLEFQTTSDGRVIFRMFDNKRTTFQAKAELTRFYEKEANDLRQTLASHKSNQAGWIARDICRYPVYAQVSSITKFCQDPQVQSFNNKRLDDEEYQTLTKLFEKFGIVEALGKQEGGPVLVHGKVRFLECQDAACTTTNSTPSAGQSMSKWIGDSDPVPVGLALNHVPSDQRDLGYVIDFDCPKDTKCQNLVLKNPERMKAKSLAEANKVLDAARDYYEKTNRYHRMVAMSLAPLHGCCADETCRNSDFGKSLKFMRADQGSSSAKPTGK